MIPSSQREEEAALYAKRYYPAVRRAGGRPETLYLFNKRVFDIAASAAALLVLSPFSLFLRWLSSWKIPAVPYFSVKPGSGRQDVCSGFINSAR